MTTNRNFSTSTNNYPTAENRDIETNEAVLLRAVKELGEYYPLARQFFGGSVGVVEETKRQLAKIQGETRTERGVIITGLLDLSKFGLSDEQVKRQNFYLKQERESGTYEKHREAMLHAVKELGPDFLDKAIEHVGSLHDIALEAESQLKHIPEEQRKKDGYIVIGLLDLRKLGLNPTEAQERNGQIEEMKVNHHRYLTVHVSPDFSKVKTKVDAGSASVDDKIGRDNSGTGVRGGGVMG